MSLPRVINLHHELAVCQRASAFRAMPVLTDLERLLVEAATAGETLDLRTAADRELRAGVVRDVLLGEHGPVDARGLQVRGAVLDGRLDLDGMQTRVRLRLRADRWQLLTGTVSGQALAAAGWLLTLLGWATATLVVAGYSGWVRRR